MFADASGGSRCFLVRHGEVHNPERVLYGRMPGFGLSERGVQMAQRATDWLMSEANLIDPVLVSSPLQRACESAAPIAAALEREPVIDERVIEPWNRFEGTQVRRALRNPRNWPLVRNPRRPTWGEPFVEIAARMRAALRDHASAAAGRDVIVVSHQLPIWMVHRSVSGQPLAHNPTQRRCALSSVTTFKYHPATDLTEVDYREPAADLLTGAIDLGAV